MTTPNDRWAEKAREILQCVEPRYQYKWFVEALHSAEKEGVRRGMAKATTLLSKLDPLETNSHGWEYGEMETVATDIHNRYVDALRQEANKESL